MSHFSFEPLRNWFGYSRRERRASTILLIIIVLIMFIRFIIPDKGFQVEEISLDITGQGVASTGSRKETVSRSTKSGQSSYRQIKSKIELNTCDSASLESLPGIGPVLSARIIKYRNLLGGFAAVEQLREVYGLPEETFKLISGRVTADSMLIRRINLSTADFKRLIRLPYLDKYDVNSILKYRELNGNIAEIEELIYNKLIAYEKWIKIRPYLIAGE